MMLAGNRNTSDWLAKEFMIRPPLIMYNYCLDPMCHVLPVCKLRFSLYTGSRLEPIGY